MKYKVWMSMKVLCECYYCSEEAFCSLLHKYQNSGGNCCFHIQAQVLLKPWYLSTKLHSATSKTTLITQNMTIRMTTYYVCVSHTYSASLTYSHSCTFTHSLICKHVRTHLWHILQTLVPSSLYLLQTCWFTHVQQLYQSGIHQTVGSCPIYSLSKTSFLLHLDTSSRRN